MRSGEADFRTARAGARAGAVHGDMAEDATGLEDFAGYASARGLTLEDGVHLTRTTPLLGAGELRSVDAVMSGWLSRYVEAKLALVTRSETTTDAREAEISAAAHFTVAGEDLDRDPRALGRAAAARSAPNPPGFPPPAARPGGVRSYPSIWRISANAPAGIAIPLSCGADEAS